MCCWCASAVHLKRCLSSRDCSAAGRSIANQTWFAPGTMHCDTLDKDFCLCRVWRPSHTPTNAHPECLHLSSLPRNMCCLQWPAVHTPPQPQNGALKLYGGAAFERCLAEFQEAAQATSFPPGICSCFPCSLLHSRHRPERELNHP